MFRLHPFCWAICCMAWLAARGVRADDFRLENSIFEGNAKAPVSTSSTLFYQGKVYDYLTQSSEATLYEPGRRFILIDPKQRQRTEVSLQDLEEFNQQLRARALASEQPLMKFLADPRFALQFGRLSARFASEWISYEVTATDASEETARQYADFADWHARLNTRWIKGSAPPFARIAVNAELLQRRWLPSRIERTTLSLSADGKRIPNMVRSEHRVSHKLSKKDLQRIEQTHRDANAFAPVPFEEFCLRQGN